MKIKKEIKIGAIVVLVISGLILFGVLISFLMIMFSPMLVEAKNIALNQYDFFIWNVVWTAISAGLIASAIGLLLYRKWGRNLMVVFSLLGLLSGFWGIWRTSKLNYLVFLYYIGILIYFGRKKLIKALS